MRRAINLENTVAYNPSTPRTDDDFTGFGHRGDLLLVVTNADAYAAEIGRRTIRYILNNLAGKLAEGEQRLAMSAGQLEAELTDV